MAPIPPSRTFPRTSYLPSMALPGSVLMRSLERGNGAEGGRRLPVRQGPPAAGTARKLGSRVFNISPNRPAGRPAQPASGIIHFPESRLGFKVQGSRVRQSMTRGPFPPPPALNLRPWARLSRGDLRRAFEMALDAIRVDGVRTRAAIVALALSMAIVVCLTTLVERGRAATIRALERAGLKNLYLVAHPGSSAGPPAIPLTSADAERLRPLAAVRATVA